MLQSEVDTIRVDVPVGRMLPEAREIEVNVERDGAPLAIRLRLIPGKTETGPAPRLAGAPHARRDPVALADDPYHLELGGSD